MLHKAAVAASGEVPTPTIQWKWGGGDPREGRPFDVSPHPPWMAGENYLPAYLLRHQIGGPQPGDSLPGTVVFFQLLRRPEFLLCIPLPLVFQRKGCRKLRLGVGRQSGCKASDGQGWLKKVVKDVVLHFDDICCARYPARSYNCHSLLAESSIGSPCAPALYQ